MGSFLCYSHAVCNFLGRLKEEWHGELSCILLYVHKVAAKPIVECSDSVE